MGRLAIKVILSIILFSLIIIAINMVFLLYSEYKRGLADIEKSIEIVEESHLKSISESVYNFDERSLDLQLQGVLSLDNIVYITVLEKRGSNDHFHIKGDSLAPVYSEKSFSLRHSSPDGSSIDLGTLTVRTNLESLLVELKDRILIVLLEQVLLILFLSIAIFVHIQRTITRHLTHFAQYANNINLRRLSQHLKLNRPSKSIFRPDEFDILESALNNMSLRIEQELSEKKKLADENKILEQQYLHAQKVDSIGQLAGGIAHDLNNLFTPIVGLSDLLKFQLKGSEYEESVHNIHLAALKSSELVQQLLTFSRKQKLGLSRINLNDVIRDFFPLLSRTLKKNIKIKTDLSEELEEIDSNKGKIEQILMNLSINAQDAIEAEGILKIRTDMVYLDGKSRGMYEGLDAGRYVLLTFSDNGIGINSEILEKIFEPFFSTKGDKGTGLGLATVYSIVMQHKGKIFVFSEPEHGTTFRMYFPISSTSSLKESKNTDNKVSGEEGFKTIMIVEDNYQVRSLTVSILSKYGYQVISVENAEEALQILREKKDSCDLLLTDIVMPGMNGWELFKESRKLNPELPVLFMSGYSDDFLSDTDRDKYNFIQKPFTINQLLKAISSSLNN